MSLINCPECGREMSNKAKNCSNCGHVVISKNNSSIFFLSKKLAIFIVTILVLIIGVQTTALSVSNTNNQRNLTYERKAKVVQDNKKEINFQKGLYIEEKILDSNVSLKTIEQARNIIKIRVSSLGISKAKVYKKDNNIIAIEVPGIFDKEKVLQTIETTGKLSFVGPNKDIILTGRDIKDVTVVAGSHSNEPIIDLKFSEAGTKKFAAATKKYIGKQIAIYMDQTMYSNPTVQSAITNGEAQITGGTDINMAKSFAGIIKSGPLPVSLKNVLVKIIK